MAFGLSAAAVSAIGVGANLVGGIMQSNAVGDASDAQQAGTAAGIAEQRRQFDLVRGDTATARGVGESALLQLARELGIPYTPGGNLTRDQARAQLLPSYTNSATAPVWVPGQDSGPEVSTPGYWQQGTNGSINEAGLNAAIDRLLAQQTTDRQTAAQDPSFGAGVRPIDAGDVLNEPGYQFGLQQGQTALDRKIAAMGGRVSGRALKEASRFNSDYATTRYAQAYDRKNQERSEKLNRWAAIAGLGQTAVGQSANSGQSSSNAISSLLTSQGNATGAASLAQGNIWANSGNQIAAAFRRKTPTDYPSYLNPLTGYGYGYGDTYEK